MHSPSPAAARFSAAPWQDAPVATGGESLFVIGDVHGCTPLLAAMLDGIAALAPPPRSRLVFLGDLIDRGPDSIGSLRLWAREQPVPGIDRVHRLMGNHEQMLLLACGTGPDAVAAQELWLSLNGDTMLAELRAAAGQPEAPPGPALLRQALGETVPARLRAQQGHLRLGNLVLVHGGADPRRPLQEFLGLPWDALAARPHHWAWITHGFLDWRDGFDGQVVVHGHTPPAKHRAISGLAEPVGLAEGRLCLDGGSAVTGTVAGAQLEDGRFRLLRSHA